MKPNVNEILTHYLICAIWTDEEQLRESDENADLNIHNVSEESKAEALKDIEKFLSLAGNAVDGILDERIGHDIWLTRNGHGSGFWDRGYEETVAKKLTKSAKALEGSDIYLGDDGMLYFS